MREYLNVYEESISQVAGVKLPPFDIKDVLNNQQGTYHINTIKFFLSEQIKLDADRIRKFLWF